MKKTALLSDDRRDDMIVFPPHKQRTPTRFLGVVVLFRCYCETGLNVDSAMALDVLHKAPTHKQNVTLDGNAGRNVWISAFLGHWRWLKVSGLV